MMRSFDPEKVLDQVEQKLAEQEARAALMARVHSLKDSPGRDVFLAKLEQLKRQIMQRNKLPTEQMEGELTLVFEPKHYGSEDVVVRMSGVITFKRERDKMCMITISDGNLSVTVAGAMPYRLLRYTGHRPSARARVRTRARTNRVI